MVNVSIVSCTCLIEILFGATKRCGRWGSGDVDAAAAGAAAVGLGTTLTRNFGNLFLFTPAAGAAGITAVSICGAALEDDADDVVARTAALLGLAFGAGAVDGLAGAVDGLAGALEGLGF